MWLQPFFLFSWLEFDSWYSILVFTSFKYFTSVSFQGWTLNRKTVHNTPLSLNLEKTRMGKDSPRHLNKTCSFCFKSNDGHKYHIEDSPEELGRKTAWSSAQKYFCFSFQTCIFWVVTFQLLDFIFFWLWIYYSWIAIIHFYSITFQQHQSWMCEDCRTMVRNLLIHLATACVRARVWIIQP